MSVIYMISSNWLSRYTNEENKALFFQRELSLALASCIWKGQSAVAILRTACWSSNRENMEDQHIWWQLWNNKTLFCGLFSCCGLQFLLDWIRTFGNVTGSLSIGGLLWDFFSELPLVYNCLFGVGVDCTCRCLELVCTSRNTGILAFQRRMTWV